LHFEFWPVYILYFPVFIYLLWLALKARSLTFYTLANPGIFLGGISGESKWDLLKKIDSKYLPNSIYLAKNLSHFDARDKIKNAHISFPFIVKPNQGERGKAVEKIENEEMLMAYLNSNSGEKIVQSFISFPIELGVLFYQVPNSQEFGITSVVMKSFLSIVGDGFKTIETLIMESERANLQRPYLLNKFKLRLTEVLTFGEVLMLEPIGNHCRGTTFMSKQELITPQLEKVFKEISKNIEGFYIGRYDLKVKSIEDLYLGKNISIMELNGIASEPAHIYDPKGSLLDAYRALFKHVNLIYKIALENKKIGMPYISLKNFYFALKNPPII